MGWVSFGALERLDLVMPTAIPNPLFELHERAEAEFQAYDQLQIVTTFGEPEAEYAAIRKGAAMVDQPQRGILELTGKDRLPFLNNLLTNETWNKGTKKGLEAGMGIYGFFLARNGRIVADMNVIERGDRTLLEMDARVVDRVREAFDKYIFSEQVKLVDRVGSLHQIALHGPGALEVVRQAAGEVGREVPELAALGSRQVRIGDVDVAVWRDDMCAAPGYHLVFDNAGAAGLWEMLITRFGTSEKLGKRALRPAGWAAFNAARIEAGRALFGIDFDDTVLPHETGLLTRAVSFTKGCYLGQEIVARMQARGQFARQLVGIKMSDDALPIAGAIIQDDSDNQIGGITSSTISPVLSGVAICLGYLKKAFTALGTIVNIPAEGKMRKGSVVETPFVKQ
jgi:folate-binding protein YgfZ